MTHRPDGATDTAAADHDWKSSRSFFVDRGNCSNVAPVGNVDYVHYDALTGRAMATATHRRRQLRRSKASTASHSRTWSAKKWRCTIC